MVDRRPLVMKETEDALSEAMGGLGFDRLTGESTHTPDDPYVWVAIKAVNGNAVFAANTAVAIGDAPSANDVLTQDDVLVGRFTAIDLTSGVVYAYRGQ